MNNQELMTDDAVVELMGGVLSTRTLANWRSQGRGPRYTKVGRACLYRRQDVEKWLETRSRDPEAA